MTQSAALLDGDLTAYFDDLGSPMTSETSRPSQWLADAAVAAGVVLLAPILVIPVALAFAVACIRMQRCDLGHDAAGRYRSARERLSRPRQTDHWFAAPVDHLPTLATSYRWN